MVVVVDVCVGVWSSLPNAVRWGEVKKMSSKAWLWWEINPVWLFFKGHHCQSTTTLSSSFEMVDAHKAAWIIGTRREIKAAIINTLFLCSFRSFYFSVLFLICLFIPLFYSLKIVVFLPSSVVFRSRPYSCIASVMKHFFHITRRVSRGHVSTVFQVKMTRFV